MMNTDKRLQSLKAVILWSVGILALVFLVVGANVWYSCANQETAIRAQIKVSESALTSVYSVLETEGAIAAKDRSIIKTALSSGSVNNPFALIQGSSVFAPDTQLMGDLKAALDTFSKEQLRLNQLGAAYQERLNRPVDGTIAHLEGFPHDGLSNPSLIVDPTAKAVHESGKPDWSSFQ